MSAQVAIAATLGLGAVIDGRYRYRLWRDLRPTRDPKRVAFVMLNPSTANATADDATIRKCVGFASAWGFDALDVVNLYALRSTECRAIGHDPAPIGPHNDEHIVEVVAGARRVVLAWGSSRKCGVFFALELMGRAGYVRRLVCDVRGPAREVGCLGHCDDGQPRHPLMLSYATKFLEVHS